MNSSVSCVQQTACRVKEAPWQCDDTTNGPLPNFIIAGASRSGTSSLHEYLRAHPNVFAPALKELHFFERDANFFDRDANFCGQSDAYRRHFHGWSGQSAIGEATPAYWLRGMTFDLQGNHRYCLEDDAGSRLAAALPAVKTIISLRNPVDRAYSQYCRNRRLGREKATSFLAALGEEQRGLRLPEKTRTCWIYHNQYAFHLRRWLELFPRQQLKVLIFEEWINKPGETIRELCEYLDIDPTDCPSEFPKRNRGWEPRSKSWSRHVSPWLGRVPGLQRLERWNQRVGYDALSLGDYQSAQDIFADEVAALEEILSRKIDGWHGCGDKEPV